MCQWYFLNYTPSSWENLWYNNIDQFQDNVCETLANSENLEKVVLIVKRMMELQKFGRSRSQSNKQKTDNLLSKMFYQQKCIDPHTNLSFKIAEVSHLIEPLVGLLRDPLTMCPRIEKLPLSLYKGAEIQSKRFLLLSVAAPLNIYSFSHEYENTGSINIPSNEDSSNVPPWMYQRSALDLTDNKLDTDKGHNILIDLGSSYFSSWNDDFTAAAGRWFYEYYKRFGVNFDRIICFEEAPLDPSTAWKQLPDDVFPIYTLINVGCTVDGKFNPWKTLQSIARPHDYVVVKLDIDTPAIEIPLINQILNDSNINSLIDELFFEHHVAVNVMTKHWINAPGTLKDTYVLFTKLRKLGIRMHSWP